ncbi:uncharacterized protein EI97DRAFT_496856 [Westerdykella ornata]|uniref:Altered inheritance of mitochondria protein 9, mitochondrial n=1 Tax=Westerdykella ornata TaxID=318751 RepID=A0A6A6J6P1_WESOR|nr:uncharacterized protein EI97DRAFT_496856 [Westerdykella ornata]KAF2272072.1 hypothetical protein EI97DRAFT_496856 [Westerdykella ornata]
MNAITSLLVRMVARPPGWHTKLAIHTRTRDLVQSPLVTSRHSAHQARPKSSIGRECDIFNYTSGRWLRQDGQERLSRAITFDFETLCGRLQAVCPGARSVKSFEKKEGGFNRIFIFTMENSRQIVVKLPYTLAGPSGRNIRSEVATIKYLQRHTKIPIPSVLDWSDSASNPIGTEYIIMAHASGVLLHLKWPHMDVESQIRDGRPRIPAYGSLYSVSSLYTDSSSYLLDEGYCIGAHCGPMFWDCNPLQPRYYERVEPNHGPWPTLSAFCDGLVDTGISRVPPAGPAGPRPRYQGSSQDHYKLLDHGRAVIKKMAEDPRIQNAARPTLYHPDLHKRNVFISEEDPTKITAFIDWQSASIEPAFWYADEVPDFAQPLAHPSREDAFEPKSEACAKVHNICLQYFSPKLAEPRMMDESLFRPFRYCYRTWNDGAPAFREELIQTARHWDELGLPQPCPYPLPTSEELEDHRKQYKQFETAQELRFTLTNLLNTASDGWVPTKDWDATKEAHKEAYAGLLREVLKVDPTDEEDTLRSEADMRELWPFDLDDLKPSNTC